MKILKLKSNLWTLIIFWLQGWYRYLCKPFCPRFFIHFGFWQVKDMSSFFHFHYTEPFSAANWVRSQTEKRTTDFSLFVRLSPYWQEDRNYYIHLNSIVAQTLPTLLNLMKQCKIKFDNRAPFGRYCNFLSTPPAVTKFATWQWHFNINVTMCDHWPGLDMILWFPKQFYSPSEISVTKDDSSSEKLVCKKSDNPTSAQLKSFLAPLSAILRCPFYPIQRVADV